MDEIVICQNYLAELLLSNFLSGKQLRENLCKKHVGEYDTSMLVRHGESATMLELEAALKVLTKVLKQDATLATNKA